MTEADEPRPSIDPIPYDDVRSQLRSVLAAIEAEELVASIAMRHRIEGAVLALEALERVPPTAEVADQE